MTEDEKALASSMNAALEALRSRLYSSVVAEAETEAWQKLIRVLTHEIMNSIAPVISLSETVAERATINGMNEKTTLLWYKPCKRSTEEVRGYWILSRIIGN